MKKSILLASLFSATFFYACDSGQQETEEGEVEVIAETEEPVAEEIILTPIEEDTQFANAILEQNVPAEGAVLEPGLVPFEFNVKNYQLTEMTKADHATMIANSDKGQHIHLILNNRPYDALYETTYQKKLEPGNYVELAFLSRSFHMSLKHPEAYVLRQFTVGDVPEEEVDLNAPHMFYSRPKGTYTGEGETDKIMLDFYLVNTELAEDGYKVRATVNDQEFMITEWQPYFLEGLPMGENTIKLELLDAEGNLVESPFNPVTRTITLEEGEEVPAS
ncbi:hypothetical protein [Nafulsella turpanensis]|uniref:hypothetical protein n=1 Tax=Nafulsella turpanensis TaxID=1265690 RepID=UPI00034CE7CF|nr:hypothetical protein [Nafulsella turpanensis]